MASFWQYLTVQIVRAETKTIFLIKLQAFCLCSFISNKYPLFYERVVPTTLSKSECSSNKSLPQFFLKFFSNFTECENKHFTFFGCSVKTSSNLRSKKFLKEIGKILCPYPYCVGLCKNILKKTKTVGDLLPSG